MDAQIQRMRLIVNGAVCLYEGVGLDIAHILKSQQRGDLLDVLDVMTTALYWLQEMLEGGGGG